MRLFIAVELPKAVRNEVGAALKELKMLSSGGRFVQENNLQIALLLPRRQDRCFRL